jgi:arginine-tRNA-protein transferase
MPDQRLELLDYETESCEEVRGEVLDMYLANGWFRMGAMMHITRTVQTGETVLSVEWLRYDVPKVELSRSNRKLIRKNSEFSVTIGPYRVTKPLLELYFKYYVSIPFEIYPFLDDAVNENGSRIFESYVIQIYDGDKLIAAGHIDKGKDCVAAIKNFYDPEYKKYSPGKYLMLLTYLYCLKKGMRWFYPGYIIPGYPKFDYKLFMDKNATEVHSIEDNSWARYYDLHDE